MDTVLRPDGPFVPLLRRAAERLAAPGALNSIAQTVLKLTAPGMPDLYQGNEAWDFSLVDPDNRRDVDFDALRARLEKLDEATPAELFAHWRDGRIKTAVTRALLLFRREHPSLFEAGGYEPVAMEGGLARHAIGFLRSNGAERLLVIVSRFTTRLPGPPVGDLWADTRAAIGGGASPWANLFTGRPVSPRPDGIRLAEVFADWPVAVLYRRESE